MFFRLVFIVLPLAIWLAMWPLFTVKVAATRHNRIAIWILLGLCYAKFVGYKTFGGSTFLPVLPEGVIWVWSFAYSFAMLLSAVMVLLAALQGVAKLLKRSYKTNTLGASAAMATSLAVAAYGIEEGYRVPSIKKRNVTLPDLPAAFDGYRICHISDLHISPAARKRHVEAIVERVRSLDADLVCITGDIIDGSVEERAEDAAPLGALAAKDGVLACTGNHEFYSDYDSWREVFAKYHIEMLENSHRLIRRGADALAVGGIMDPQGATIGRAGAKQWELPDVHVAFGACDKNAFRILLAHRPTRTAEHAAEGVKLQLSGHTHGGAIRGMDLVVAKMNENHVRGFYREHGLTLFVSPGTGQWAGFPARIGVPSEITLLTLRK